MKNFGVVSCSGVSKRKMLTRNRKYRQQVQDAFGELSKRTNNLMIGNTMANKAAYKAMIGKK